VYISSIIISHSRLALDIMTKFEEGKKQANKQNKKEKGNQ